MSKGARVCVIRHGETDWNAERRIQGHRDLPLNATGLAQATALARSLADLRVDAIFSSDLLRARQTAQPLADALGLPLQLEPDLRERNFGCCEGKTIDEVMAGDAVVARGLSARRPDFVLPGGESLLLHWVRVEACFEGLAARHAGQTIVVVSHGGVLDLVYRRARCVPIERPRDFPLPNASVNWLSIDSECWELESWGETAHLDGIPQIAFVTRI